MLDISIIVCLMVNQDTYPVKIIVILLYGVHEEQDFQKDTEEDLKNSFCTYLDRRSKAGASAKIPGKNTLKNFTLNKLNATK